MTLFPVFFEIFLYILFQEMLIGKSLAIFYDSWLNLFVKLIKIFKFSQTLCIHDFCSLFSSKSELNEIVEFPNNKIRHWNISIKDLNYVLLQSGKCLISHFRDSLFKTYLVLNMDIWKTLFY